jgi:hypothetical protein
VDTYQTAPNRALAPLLSVTEYGWIQVGEWIETARMTAA